MLSARAFTEINPGFARLGNAWMERAWSTLTGQTTGLVQRDTPWDWLEKAGPGIGLEIAGVPEDLFAFADTEWSEFYHPSGAGLLLRQTGPRLGVVSRFFAFHHAPGILRSTELYNRSGEFLDVRAAPEILPVRRSGVQIRTHGFEQTQECIAWDTDESAAALVAGRRGLILGMENGGRFELFNPRVDWCALSVPTPQRMAPGQTWALPDTFTLVFSVPMAPAEVLSGFLQALRQKRQWDKERAMSAAEPEADTPGVQGSHPTAQI